MVIRAQIPANIDFDKTYGWAPSGVAGVTYAINGKKISVPRDKPGKYPVVLKTRNADGSLGATVDTLNVWIVWCDVTSNLRVARFNYGIDTNGIAYTARNATFDYQAGVNPREICDTKQDIPDLTKRTADTPHFMFKHALDGRALGQSSYAWELARQWRERDIVPIATGVTSTDLALPTYSALFATIPNDNIVQITSEDQNSDNTTGGFGYPLDEVEGNDTDDHSGITPYGGSQFGKLVDSDTPSDSISYSAGHVGDAVEFHTQFREFVRLNIGSRWYRISDAAYARFHTKFKKVSEVQLGRDIDGDGKIEQNLWIIDDASSKSDILNTEF